MTTGVEPQIFLNKSDMCAHEKDYRACPLTEPLSPKKTPLFGLQRETAS